MYFQLGDIKFEGLIGFESFTDSVEAVYAQHDLINRKPKLQRTGDTLREFSGTIQFHSSFCIPEDQYLKLEGKRKTGEALPLIYGNGRYEGDYYLKTLSRTPNHTAPNGDYISLTCSITLIEADSVLSPSQLEAQAKSSAFALTSNRPLPVGTSVTDVNNPALSVMNENKAATQGAAKMVGVNETADKKVADINASSGQITAAQAFVNMAPSVMSKMSQLINDIGRALDNITALLIANRTMNSVSPDLNASVNASKIVAQSAQAIVSNLQTLPAVNTTADAIYVLNVQKNSLISAKDLADSLKVVNDSAAGIAGAIATKQKLS